MHSNSNARTDRIGPIFVFGDNLQSDCVSLWFFCFVKTPQGMTSSPESSNLDGVLENCPFMIGD